MAVTPGLKAAAGIKKGDSMTVQRKLWAEWKKNKEGDRPNLAETRRSFSIKEYEQTPKTKKDLTKVLGIPQDRIRKEGNRYYIDIFKKGSYDERADWVKEASLKEKRGLYGESVSAKTLQGAGYEYKRKTGKIPSSSMSLSQIGAEV